MPGATLAPSSLAMYVGVTTARFARSACVIPEDSRTSRSRAAKTPTIGSCSIGTFLFAFAIPDPPPPNIAPAGEQPISTIRLIDLHDIASRVVRAAVERARAMMPSGLRGPTTPVKRSRPQKSTGASR